jgi:hypothetical protein
MIQLKTWRNELFEEIAEGACKGSRGRINPRGVKREMGNFPIRYRGQSLQRRFQNKPIIAE